jgi:sortase A
MMDTKKTGETRPAPKTTSSKDVIHFQVKLAWLGRMRRWWRPNLPKIMRWMPNIMILAGLVALPFVVMRFRATEQKFNSPFDQVDYDEENEQGFLPMLAQVRPTFAPDGAEPASQAGANADLPSEEDNGWQQVRVAPPVDGSPDDLAARPADVAANPGLAPEHLLIPAIDLFVPVNAAENHVIEFEGKAYLQWEAPRGQVAGWQTDSAGLGVPGNTVLYGHHNIYGKVFENLHKVQVGQVLQLKSGDELFTYRVVVANIVEEKYQDLEVRLENARWIMPSKDERITLITCWPATGNSHRVIVVAVREEPTSFIPVSGETAQTGANVPSSPAEDLIRMAPPIDGFVGKEFAAAPDLAANPGLAPERLLIPIIELYVPVLKAEEYVVEEGEGFRVQWWAPRVVAAGWQPDSAGLGVPGNTILYGHLDVYGAVFAGLPRLQPGQVIQLKAGEDLFSYRVVFSKIFAERCPEWAPQSEAARWVLPSSDERITLVTCYPAGGYTHRMVVVAARE